MKWSGGSHWPLITASLQMSDVFTKAKRSEVMSRIRGRGNKDTEMALAKLLRANRITGWRRNQPVFGKPDFVFQKFKLALFVDGFFASRPQSASTSRAAVVPPGEPQAARVQG